MRPRQQARPHFQSSTSGAMVQLAVKHLLCALLIIASKSHPCGCLDLENDGLDALPRVVVM